MCNKKQYVTKWEAKKALFSILARSSKNPWRDELSVYECECCNSFHISSKNTDYIPTSLREKSYYDIQKEKWGSWLQNYASKGATINKTNKKYST